MPPPLTILRLKTVQARTGLGRSTLYAKMDPKNASSYDASFPKSVSLSPRGPRGAIGWIDEEISDWVATRIAASRAR